MYRYQKEFGLDFDLGFDLAIFPFLFDKSRQKDRCPSFIFGHLDHSGQWCYQVLWVDYFNVELRLQHNARYTVLKARVTDLVGADFELDEASPLLFESESSNAVCRYLMEFQ